MTIIINSETENGTKQIEFSNEDLDNFNLVDLIVDGKEYTISVDDLVVVVEAFKRLKELNR